MRLSSDYPSEDKCVLLFVKYPEPGRVKNRLATDLQGIRVVELYQAFVLDILGMLANREVPFQICYYPEDTREMFGVWLGERYSYLPQKGKDLGERMRNSFLQAFLQGFSRVIIMGSDCPDLPGTFIADALLSLKTMDSVIGPSFDGGYYLIGFKEETFIPEIFEGIRWSSDTVFQESLKVMEQARHKTYILPKWRDVDTLHDLKDLVQRGKTSEFIASKTMSFLLRHNLSW